MALELIASALVFSTMVEIQPQYQNLPECAIGHAVSRVNDGHTLQTQCSTNEGMKWLEVRDADGYMTHVLFHSVKEAEYLIRKFKGVPQ